MAQNVKPIVLAEKILAAKQLVACRIPMLVIDAPQGKPWSAIFEVEYVDANGDLDSRSPRKKIRISDFDKIIGADPQKSALVSAVVDALIALAVTLKKVDGNG